MAYSVQGYASYPSLMLKKNATIVCVYGCAMIRPLLKGFNIFIYTKKKKSIYLKKNPLN